MPGIFSYSNSLTGRRKNQTVWEDLRVLLAVVLLAGRVMLEALVPMVSYAELFRINTVQLTIRALNRDRTMFKTFLATLKKIIPKNFLGKPPQIQPLWGQQFALKIAKTFDAITMAQRKPVIESHMRSSSEHFSSPACISWQFRIEIMVESLSWDLSAILESSHKGGNPMAKVKSNYKKQPSTQLFYTGDKNSVGVVFKDYPLGKSVRKEVIPASIPDEEEYVSTREVSTCVQFPLALPCVC